MKDKIKYVELVERLKRDIDLPEGVDDVFLVKAFFDKNPKAAEGVDMEDVTIPERYDVGTMAKIIRHEVGKFDGTDEELVNLFLEKNPSYKDQVDLKKKDFNIYEATQEGLGYIGGKKETEKRSNDPIGYIQEDIDKLVKEKDRLERKSIVTSTKDIAWSRSIYTGDKKFSSSDDAVEYERINKKILELEDQKRKLEVQIERKRLDNKYAPHYESYKEYIKNVPDDIDVLKNEKERELKDIAKSGAGYKEFVYGRTMYAYKPTPILEDEESRKRYDQLQREVKELDALKSLRMEDAYALSTDLDAESRQELRYYIKQRVEEDEVKRQANKLFREKYPDKLYPDEAVEKFTIEVERLFADASRLKGELLNKAKVSKSQFDLEMKELDASIEAELLQKKAELEQMYDAGAISVDDANRQLEELRKNKTLIYNEHIRRYNSNVIDALNNAHISLFDTFKGKLSDLEREYGVTIDGKLSKDVVDRYEDVFAEVYAERQRFSMAKWNALPRSAQIAMSFSAGVLDLFNSIGGGLNWLGYYEAGNYLSDMAMDFYKSADIPVFELDKLLTPDWWIANGVRTLPFTLSLLPTGYGVTLGLSSALARTAMPVLLRQLVAGAGGALINRPIEGWFNAGGSFNEAMEMGMSVEQASQVAADVMKNEAFLYFNDAMQLGLAFTPAKGFLSKLLLFLYEGASEGIEELLQGYWQHNAIARRDDETPILSLMEYAKTDMALTEMILGTATGLAFQGGAETIKYIAGMKNIDADKFAEDKITNYMITNFFSDEESNVPLEKRRDDAFNMIDVFMERGSLTEEQADYHKKMTNYAYELKVSGLGFDEDTRVALLEYYGNILASELLLSKLGDKNIDAAISEKLNRQRADLQKMLSGEIAIYMINESIISNEQFKKFIDDPLFIEKFVNDNIKVKVVNSDLTLMDKLAQRADEFTKYKQQQAEQQTEQQAEQQTEQQTEQQAEQQAELKTDEISTQPQKEVSTQPQLKKDEVIRDRAFIKRAKREGLTPIEMAKNNLKRIYDRFVKLGHEVVKDDEGKVTLGDAIKMFKRATGMSTKAISEVLKFATPDVKWHLTGNMQKKYGSGVGITNFINPNQIAYIANNWDEIVKDLALVKVKMRDAVKNRAEYKKKIDAFVKRNATYVERTKNASLDNFHVVKQEMKGVFGWFDSRGKNFKLAEYYSGWVFDSRDAYIEFVGMLNRYGSTYDGLSVSEDESGRYMSNPDAKYPEIPESKLGSTVKAIWSKGQAFKFTGSTCIGSAADVAYLMRLLEDAAVEHVFAVHIDENGNSFIQHVSVGGVSKAIVDAKIIAAGVKQFNSKMVYLIHNHPTGNVTPSNNDYFVTETIKKVLGDDVTVAHVIMDTYRMDYSVHYDRGSWSEHRRESKGRGVTMPYDYYMMDKYELLSYPYGNIGSVNDAVTFVQQMRFSAFPKLGMIVMNNSGDVIANYILGNTFDFNKAYHLASSTPTGSSVIFYGNNREVVKVVDEKYRFFIGQMYVRDYIVVDSNSSGVTGFYSTHEQFDITVSKAQSVYGTDSVYNHGEPDPYIVSESDSKDYDLRNWIDEDKLTNMELFKIEFPELVYLAKEFLSAEVIVGVLAANMWGRAIFSDKVRKIKLSKELFEKATYDDLSKVLGHEIGHIIDRLAKVKGSNLLGNIAGLMNYRETLLPESPGRSNILTDEDRKRLKKEAEKQIKEEAEKSMVEIVEEVVSKIPYYEDIGVSPKDIVDIWNNVDSDLRSRNPELYNYIASLDTKGKRAIVTKAMQGYVDEFIQRRYGRILKYKDIVEKIRKSIKTKPVTAEAISERFSELLREEINKRRLFELETIREELKTLSKWWKEFDEKLNPKYTKYRFSNRELYADALSVLFNAPHELAERAPFFNRAFFNYFGVRPEAKSGYEHLQTLLKDPNMVLAERSHRVRKGFEEARQKVLEQWNKSKKHKFGVASSFWMKYFSIIDVLIKNVPDVTSNYGKLTPRQKIQNAVEMIAFIDNEHFSLLDKITREVVLPLEMLGVDLDTFGEALTYIRIIEGRSDKAAPLGLQEMFSVEGLNFIREKMSVEVEKVFFDKIRLFHEYIHGALVKIQAESNMFSDKQMSIIFKNKYNYATFRDIKYVGNFVPAVIKPIKGTLNAIQNPFEATLAYVFALQRAARKTYAKNMTLEFLMKYDPLGVENAKRTRQGFIVKKDRYLLDFYEKGEHVGYYVDPYFEYIFEVVKDNDLASLTKLFKYFNKGFKPLVTEFNPGFAFMFNVLRDTNRAKVDLTSIVGDGKVIPIEESLRVRAHLVSHFLSSFKQGRGVYYGNIEPVINEMIDAGVFDIRTGISSNYNVSEQESVDIVASRLFPEVYNRKYKRWRELNEATKTLSAFGHLYRSTARGLELGTKINAYKFLRKSGFDIEAASFYARNIAGTPNWKRYGLHTVWLNQWSPFSNVTLQGLGMDLTLATKRKTAGGFWYSVIAGAVLPGILQGLLASGLFDERLRKIYDKIPNYHKYNFLCIPFDTTDDGAVRYFVLPFGEITRLFFSIGFAMSRVLADERPVGVRELKHIFNVGASYTLSIHPLIEIVHGWGQYLFGKSPTTYMGSDVVPSYMMAAGKTWEGTKKMLSWTASTLGASWILTMVSYDPYENRFTEYGFKNVPILNRIYKETKAGELEKYWDLVSKVDKDRKVVGMREKLYLKKVVEEYGKQFTEMKIDLRDKDQVVEQRRHQRDFLDRKIKEYIGVDKITTAEQVDIYRRMFDTGHDYIYAGVHNEVVEVIRVFTYAPTLEAKCEVLNMFRRQEGEEAYQELLNYLKWQGRLSNDFFSTWHKMYGAEEKKRKEEAVKKEM